MGTTGVPLGCVLSQWCQSCALQKPREGSSSFNLKLHNNMGERSTLNAVEKTVLVACLCCFGIDLAIAFRSSWLCVYCLYFLFNCAVCSSALLEGCGVPGAVFHCAGLESLTLMFESVCAVGQLQGITCDGDS